MIYHFYNATYITVGDKLYTVSRKSQLLVVKHLFPLIIRGTNANLKFALSLILCEKIKLKSLVISNKE